MYCIRMYIVLCRPAEPSTGTEDLSNRPNYEEAGDGASEPLSSLVTTTTVITTTDEAEV